MTKPLSPQAQAVKKSADDAYWLWDQMCPADANIIATAALRAVVDTLSYEYHYHMDDGEGGIQYNCKNTIIDVNELNELIHELEETK